MNIPNIKIRFQKRYTLRVGLRNPKVRDTALGQVRKYGSWAKAVLEKAHSCVVLPMATSAL